MNIRRFYQWFFVGGRIIIDFYFVFRILSIFIMSIKFFRNKGYFYSFFNVINYFYYIILLYYNFFEK